MVLAYSSELSAVLKQFAASVSWQMLPTAWLRRQALRLPQFPWMFAVRPRTRRKTGGTR